MHTKQINKPLGKPMVCYFAEDSLLVLLIEKSLEPTYKDNNYYVVQAIDNNPLYREIFNLDEYDKAVEAFNIRKDSYCPDLSSELLKHAGPKNYIFVSRGVSAKLKVAELKRKFPPTE